MRLPGSFNRKYQPPCRVRVYRANRRTLDYAGMRELLKPYSKPRVIHRGKGQSLASYPEQRVYMSFMADACGVLGDVLETGGEGLTEPAWMQTLHLAAFCEDGEDYAHALSSGHADYDEALTDRKFEQRLAAREGGVGPTTCETLRTLADGWPALCGSCPYNGKVKSPVQLGALEGPPRPAAAATGTDDDSAPEPEP